MMKKLIILLIFPTLLILYGCSQKEVYSKDIYYKGVQAYKEKKYSKAQDLLKKAIYNAEGMTTEDVMNAKFILADVYFKQEMFIDAIVEFEEYITLYPTAPNVPEALYKLAVSYYKVAPDYRRDLTYLRKAEEKALEIIVNYPESSYAKKAEELIKKIKKVYARHYLDIADLYYNLGKYYSASVYYKMVLSKYKVYIDQTKVKKKLAESLLNSHLQYREKIREYKEKIEELREQISKEKNIEKRNVLQNRKRLIESLLFELESRIKESKIEGENILQKL